MLSLGASLFRYATNRCYNSSTIHLTHVKWITGKRQLKNYFSKFGSIKEVQLFYDPKCGLHKGFGNVVFDSPQGMMKAIQHKPHVIDGDVVGVEIQTRTKR
ncbi:unnamed protein product [Bursaphelenchus xylophilus]|uniref:(pine wood nematode) hypothetical protein n=1 Tax=Bursaphelenchus xylophilus TaxID=6326 RepID=A0A1I7SSL0_BURXY|nr:unnamed protein product [Bursaphelenchus xylophilus]CAG9097441.1 unnamed protein product [Bursaphelenchus xylophilus]